MLIVFMWALVAIQGYILSTDPTNWFVWLMGGITLGAAIHCTSVSTGRPW